MDIPSFSKDNLRVVLKYPTAAIYPFRDLNRWLHQKLYAGSIEPGQNVMQKDWDNLIIIDCARVDYLREMNDLPGELTSVQSVGSTSVEFLKKTFEGKEYHDTIYVTANSSYNDLSNRIFFLERIYRGNTVKERYENVEKLIEKTVDLHERYPNKRLITHIMMPHTPYLSERASKFREEVAERCEVTFRTDDYSGKTDPSDGLLQLASLLTAKRFGLLTDEKLEEVYRRDLKDVIARVEQLAESLNGKTVVTSDHGEMIGEQLPPLYLRDWGHSDRLKCPELRQVPWLVLQNDGRREVRTDEPIDIEEIDKEIVEESLEALGYK